MNMQAMLKQAKQLQNDMLKAQKEIDAKTFTGKSSFVTVEMSGTKELLKVKIDMESIDKDEIELVEDMIQVAVNDVLSKIEKETTEKLGKFTQGMPGLF
jgi:DNA-binding YbaB/EbfC family protein